MAFVSPVSTLARPTSTPLAISTFTPQSSRALVVTNRQATLRMAATNENKKIPQGFTPFSEQLNGRYAMVGFVLALVTELLTGKGIVGQVGSIFDVLKTANLL